MIIAMDGPAASGKGVLGRGLAVKYNLSYMDTGLLYRAVGHALLCGGNDPDDETNALRAARDIDPVLLDDFLLRGTAVANAASIVAAIPSVRACLIDIQRTFAKQLPGAVLDGRDIGSVICPDADVKLFITASAEVRAYRRFCQLVQRGETITLAEVLKDILYRDRRDAEREVAPLCPAPDARLLDTTKSSIEDAFCDAVFIVDSIVGPSE